MFKFNIFILYDINISNLFEAYASIPYTSIHRFVFLFSFFEVRMDGNGQQPPTTILCLNRDNQAGPRGVLPNDLLYKLQPFVLYGIYFSNLYFCWCQSNLVRFACYFYFVEMTFVTMFFPCYLHFYLFRARFVIILDIRVFLLNFHLRFFISFSVITVLQITCFSNSRIENKENETVLWYFRKQKGLGFFLRNCFRKRNIQHDFKSVFVFYISEWKVVSKNNTRPRYSIFKSSYLCCKL